MYTNTRPETVAPLAPARRTGEFELTERAFVIGPGAGNPEQGTNPATSLDKMVTLWVARQAQWYSAFQQKYAANIKRYWHIWRNFEEVGGHGVGQEWRDRTNIPESFKLISTRVPRIILGLWGVPEPWGTKGRGFEDEKYEEQCRVLMQEALDDIGNGDPECETFYKKQVDGTTYSQIMGHVWWKVFWRRQTTWLKTKERLPEGGWRDIEVLTPTYDNVDLAWLPLTQLAIDVYGRPRRWAIERRRTSLEALRAEDRRFQEETGQKLYPGLYQFDSPGMERKAGPLSYAGTEEPRDTEHWPLDHDGAYHDPAETPCELWLCYDNVQRTLTKIADRRVILDHGLCDTPDGLDPFVGQPAVPIPGQPYGDSILNWTWQLNALQNKIARARADETLLNMFQQYVYREGVVGPSTWFWRPGGGISIKAQNQERPLSDHIMLLQRRPVPPEAYSEEQYRQTQQEAIAGADSVSLGVEATSKSRDVTAAEINQRVLQGATRFQLEIFYQSAAYKRPLLQKVFDLIKQNLTTPKMLRVLDDQEGEWIDLTRLNRPIDIVITDPIFDATQAEKLQEIDRFTALANPNSAFAPFLKPREMLLEMFRSTKTLRRSTSKFVRSEEEALASPMGMAQAGTGGAPSTPQQPGPTTTLPPGSQGAGAPGAAGLGNAAGQTPQPAPPPAGGAFESF